MNIAIVGCGYVGVAVARRWRQSGHIVTATTTTLERVPELEEVAQRVVMAKVDDEEALKSVVENQDVVLLSIGARNRNVYEETYLGGAKTLVAALKQTPGVKQLIYTSSYSVYGDKKGELVDEETPASPVNENNRILYEAENVLSAAASNELRVCVLRLTGIYGPGRELVKIFGAVAGTSLPGTGEEVTNWIHLDDIVGALEFVSSKRLQGIYNLGNDARLTKRQLLDRLCDRHGLAKVGWDASAPSLRPYNVRVSNQKIKKAGYELIHQETLV